MITKQTTQAQRTHQNGGTARSRRGKAVSIGLMVSAMLIAFALGGGRANISTMLAPVADQPNVGRAMTVTGMKFDGTRYRNGSIAVGAPTAGRGYTVTALVYDGMTYRSHRS
jgi:hypothetical protein